MYRARTIKKKTRNRLILLQNLKKGKARKEARCAFQMIPYPLKFASTSRIHCLYADVVLMEHNGTLVSEASLFNNFKLYKSIQIVPYPGQKMMKIKVESKVTEPTDWKPIVERLKSSESSEMHEWGDLVKDFCEKYEAVIKDLQNQIECMSPEKHKSLVEMNARSEKIRQNIIKTYPCIEFKCELRGDRIEFTEMAPSEKYLAEVGYTFETFAATVLEGGIPEIIPLNSEGASAIAKVRLQRCVTLDQNEYLTREFESQVIMKGGYTKKLKYRNHYLTFYDKGVFGFVLLGAIIGRQKSGLVEFAPQIKENKLSTDFVELMSHREKEMESFLSNFYNQSVDKKYTNLDRICKVKEIKHTEDL